MPAFSTLEEHAEHIRVQTAHLSAQLFRALGTDHPVAIRSATLCEETARIVTGRQMEREQAEIEQLDLALLPPISTNPFDDE